MMTMALALINTIEYVFPIEFTALSTMILKAAFHLQEIFRGQEQNGKEKLMSMRVGHLDGKFSSEKNFV